MNIGNVCASAGREVGDDEVVDRQAERQQRGGEDARAGSAGTSPSRTSSARSRRGPSPPPRGGVGKPGSRARTVTTTKLMLNMMWAIRIVTELSGKNARAVAAPIATNSVSSEAPSTISGVAIGRKMNRLVAAPPAEVVADQGQRDQRARGRSRRASTAARSTRLGRDRLAEARPTPNGLQPGVEREPAATTKLNLPAGSLKLNRIITRDRQHQVDDAPGPCRRAAGSGRRSADEPLARRCRGRAAVATTASPSDAACRQLLGARAARA